MITIITMFIKIIHTKLYSLPSFSCPAMCSGKGVCEWNQGMGVCNCFDPTDDTPGCVNSPVNKPRDPSLGIKEATMSLLAFIIVVFTIVLI